MLIEQLNRLLSGEHNFLFYMYIVLDCFCVIFLSVALYMRLRKKWDSLYYIFMCLMFLFWTLHILWPQAGFFDASTYLGDIVRKIVMMSFPAMLCLHVWKQVSHKRITIGILSVLFSIPLLIAAVIIIRIWNPQFLTAQIFVWSNYLETLFVLYVVATFVKAGLLCLNVFYQMPRRMRKSTYSLLAGIFFWAFFMVANVLYDGIFIDAVGIVSAFVALVSMLSAMEMISSSEVIVTSREFVFSNLSTIVFVANRDMRILDWNKNSIKAVGVLPSPRYREPFLQYKERIAKHDDGRSLGNVENVITTEADAAEYNFLFTVHESRHKDRLYGYIIEIWEVTNIYAALRDFEKTALRDYLTDLYSRNAYFDAVQEIRVPGNMPLSVIVGDVNRLKETNDIKGHLAGDGLLKAVAAAIKRSLPAGGVAYRIGGDEFVVLIPKEGAQTAKDVIRNINKACSLMRDDLYGTPSITWGYAVMRTEDEDYNDVFNAADSMMYEEKKKQKRVFRSSGLLPENLLSKGEDTPEK